MKNNMEQVKVISNNFKDFALNCLISFELVAFALTLLEFTSVNGMFSFIPTLIEEAVPVVCGPGLFQLGTMPYC